MNEKETKQHQIQIELDDQTGQGEYSNLTIASHSQAEFILDFIRVAPGLKKSKSQIQNYNGSNSCKNPFKHSSR